MFGKILLTIGAAMIGASAALMVGAQSAAAPPVPLTTTSSVLDQGVLALQRRLAELGYDVGTPDGTFGDRTRHSLIAFQKIEGLTRDGKPGPQVTAALTTATKPGPVVAGGEPTRVEIDLKRQVLLFWKDGKLARILPTSTGAPDSPTPTGRFVIERKVPGVDPGPLGKLYSPMYFHHGVAIHGYPSIPTTAASHGCARIPMYAAPSFYEQVPMGTPVYVT